MHAVVSVAQAFLLHAVPICRLSSNVEQGLEQRELYQVCQVQLPVTSQRDLPDSTLQLMSLSELVASSYYVSKRQHQSFRSTKQC